MGFAGIIIGIVAIVAGILLANSRKKKIWYLMTAAGGVLLIAGIAYVALTLLLVNGIKNQPAEEITATPTPTETAAPITAEPTIDPMPELEGEIVGDDWRTYGISSDVYEVGDGRQICFVWNEDYSGWDVYIYDDGSGFTGQFLYPYYTGEGTYTNDYSTILTGDYNGDGSMDIGFEADNGDVDWYYWDNTEEAGGWMEYIWTDSKQNDSMEFMPYEAYRVNTLTDEQLVLYNEMKTNVESRTFFSYKTAEVGNETLDNMLIAWSALTDDYPEYDNYFTMMEVDNENGEVLSFDSVYDCEWEDEKNADPAAVESGIEAFDQECDDIISKMPLNASTYEKYRYLAAAVSLRADYDYDMNQSSDALSYGMLTGTMICQGYAESFQVLCARAGLFCRLVSGSSRDWAHAWNLVWVDGAYYHVDITWADELGVPGTDGWQQYFMLTEEEILTDHTIIDDTMTETSDRAVITKDEAFNLVSGALASSEREASVIVEEGTEQIANQECWLFAAGDNSADGAKFTAMYHYAVSEFGDVYYLNILESGEWEAVN